MSNNTAAQLTVQEKAQTLQVFSEMVNRALLATKMGQQTYGGARDVNTALGYPTTLQFDDYHSRYLRHDMAKAIIDRPVKGTWKGKVELIETDADEYTPLEKAWKSFYRDRKLKLTFSSLDKLTGIGRYSVLFFGMSDVVDMNSYKRKVRKGAKLMYLKPLSEKTAKIHSLDTDPTSERYGLPKFYEITLKDVSNVNSTSTGTLLVHYSRVLHIVEDTLEDPNYGTPRLEAAFNRLLDLEKIVGGDAEMFWRGARPGYTGDVKENYTFTPEDEKKIKDQFEEFQNYLSRFLVTEGINYKELAQQIADPASHADTVVKMLSAVTGIPFRILIGSEKGELSSSQDKQEWVTYVTTRREEVVEFTILRPFIDKCIELEILPKGTSKDGYTIVWDSLFSLTEKEKAEIGKARAVILKEYSLSETAQAIIPMEYFLKHMMFFDEKTADLIKSKQPKVIPKPQDTSRLRPTEIIKKEKEKKIKDN